MDSPSSPGGRHQDRPFRIILVAGARPNFVKIAPIHALLTDDPAFDPMIVHTGQHYDEAMSKVFFEQLDIPVPDINLEVGSDTHARQTSAVMMAFEEAISRLAPDLVMVVGDVNSTLACALVSQRAGVPVAHVESGLRSGDRTMPEEINRILTDQLSDWLYLSSEDAGPNLTAEGIPEERMVFVGNVMIDSLARHVELAREVDILDTLGVREGEFALTTLHRPSNVDDPDVLVGIVRELGRLSARLPVVFPAHPRTRARLRGLRSQLEEHPDLRVVDPLGYLAFLRLTGAARLVLTDSGGIQEETTWLGVPCLTLRTSTERPITIHQGTNELVPPEAARIRDAVERALSREIVSQGEIPRLWDGHAASRIVQHLKKTYVEL